MYKHIIDSETLRQVAKLFGRDPWGEGKMVQTRWKISQSLAQVITDSAKELNTSAGKLMAILTIEFMGDSVPQKLIIPPDLPQNLTVGGRETVLVQWNVPPGLLGLYSKLFKKTKIKNVFFVEAVIVWAMNNQPKREN